MSGGEGSQAGRAVAGDALGPQAGELVGVVAELGREAEELDLRVAASGDARLGKIAGVVAVSPVLHPDNAMRAMEQGLQVYQRYFVRKWSRSLRRKQSLWQGLIHADIFHLRDLRGMTAAMVARHTNFPDIGAYLDGYAITGDRLARLAAPAVILASRDDPIIPAEDLPRLASPPALRVVVTERGGHMGFLISPRAESWVNGFVKREMGLSPQGS